MTAKSRAHDVLARFWVLFLVIELTGVRVYWPFLRGGIGPKVGRLEGVGPGWDPDLELPSLFQIILGSLELHPLLAPLSLGDRHHDHRVLLQKPHDHILLILQQRTLAVGEAATLPIEKTAEVLIEGQLIQLHFRVVMPSPPIERRQVLLVLAVVHIIDALVHQRIARLR